MKSEWVECAILRVASLLAPGDRRAGWLEEWQSELWYIPRCRAMRFCLGAFQDALWLRGNNPHAVKRTQLHLESPLRCFVFLAALAAAGILIAVSVPVPQPGPWPAHMRARDLPGGCMAMLVLFCLALPVMRWVMGRLAADRAPLPWAGRLRRGMFLALKIALVQPIMLGGFVAMNSIAPVVPLAPLAFGPAFILLLRWILTDQSRRCPVCLRLLTDPVRVGTASGTFLEWYGAESVCSRGHGLLHVPEIPSTGNQQWLTLDSSWSGLFSEAARGRHS